VEEGLAGGGGVEAVEGSEALEDAACGAGVHGVERLAGPGWLRAEGVDLDEAEGDLGVLAAAYGVVGEDARGIEQAVLEQGSEHAIDVGMGAFERGQQGVSVANEEAGDAAGGVAAAGGFEAGVQSIPGGRADFRGGRRKAYAGAEEDLFHGGQYRQATWLRRVSEYDFCTTRSQVGSV
jgi:hypothetical protein